MSVATHEQFNHEELVADVRELVAEIEGHHVDPFATGYDSRVELHATAEQIIQDLPEAASTEEAWREIAPLVAGLRDIHSHLHPPETMDAVNSEETEPDDAADSEQPESVGEFPLSCRVVGEELFVESVADERLEPYVGQQLLAVEGVPTATLSDRLSRYHGVENEYGAAAELARRLTRPNHVGRLLQRDEPPAKIFVRLETPAGFDEVALQAQTDTEPVASTEASVAQPDGRGPRYSLYADGDVAVFTPGDLQGYRESLEQALAREAGYAQELIEQAYERHVGGDLPADIDDAVAALPSMMETVHDATAAMEAAGTETLIVDLRHNPGGDSRYARHLAHALFGREGVATATQSVAAVKRRTDPHEARFGRNSGEEGEDSGEYDLSSYLDTQSEEDPAADALERLRRAESAAKVLDENRETIYEPPQVIVTVSASTMSSGFAGVAGLSTLGADVVGVPSGQAPISFGESVERTLSNTGLTASLSGALFEWTPDPDGSVLDVDAELTPTLYKQYDRAADAGLRLAFDYAGFGSDPPEPVESADSAIDE